MRRLLAIVAILALSAPAVAQDIGARSVFSEVVTAQAAAWTDVTISSADCVTEACITGLEASFLTVFSSGAASYLLLRAADGEATSEAIYIPSDGAISIPVYGSSTTVLSIHGGGNTPTVYVVAGLR